MSRLTINLARKSFSLLAVLLLSFASTATAQVQTQTTPVLLELNKRIEREIAGETTHSYALTLTRGQYAYVVVNQKGADALLIVYRPDGSKLFQVDGPNEEFGPEPLSLLAETAGTYRIEVKSQTNPSGRYEIRLNELRLATQQDRSRVVAQQLCVDARALRNKRTEQSYEQAVEKYLQALAIWRSLDDKPMEAATLYQAGWLYGDIGQYQKALDSYAEARSIYKSLGDLKGEASTVNNTAWIYGELGEDQRALEMYEQALETYTKLGDTDPTVISNVASSYSKVGQYQRALTSHLRVLEMRRATDDRRGLSITLSNIGNCYYLLGDKTKALDFYNESLKYMLQNGDNYYTATVLNHLGVAYRSLGDYDKALNYFNSALAYRKTSGDHRGIATSLSDIARLERDRGNVVEARKRIEETLAEVELVRLKVASPRLRTSYFASVQQYREFYIDLLMRLHKDKPSEQLERVAFNASETGRARSLLQLLSEASNRIRHGIEPSLLERKRQLAELIDREARSQMELLSGKHTEAEADAARKQLSALTTELEELEGRIRESSPQFTALVQPVPLSLEQIQQNVLDRETLLLEYSLGEERSFLWAVTPDAIKSFELPKRAVIEPAARQVYELLTARTVNVPNETLEQRRERLELADAEYETASAMLSRLILGPVAAELKDKRLLIVGDGVLQYIPFAGLPDPTAIDTRPLIVAHEVVTAPSASVVGLLRQETANRKPASKMVAVLADPVFSNNDPRVAAARLSHPNHVDKSASTYALRSSEPGLSGLRRLRFSRQEADEIARLAGSDSKLKAVDFAANRTLATSGELGQYRVVHFATHGIINSNYPELSGIVLSLVDEKSQPQNGFLRLYDLYNLKLSADLVVLSACQTALGKEIRGEGLVGLTRGFMYAGAPRVIASLWQIDDRASAELMKRFYGAMLGEKLRPAAALRAAQVSMSKDPRWRKPNYWAAFTLQGEWK
jgi:CHAT domain-containing protein/Tfp pilus assembly protein PilF